MMSMFSQLSIELKLQGVIILMISFAALIVYFM